MKYLALTILTLLTVTGCSTMKSPDSHNSFAHQPETIHGTLNTARPFKPFNTHGTHSEGREMARKYLATEWAKLLEKSGMHFHRAIYSGNTSEEDDRATMMSMEVTLEQVTQETGPQIEQAMATAAKELGWGQAARSTKLSVRTETLFLDGGFLKDKCEYRMDLVIIHGPLDTRGGPENTYGGWSEDIPELAAFKLPSLPPTPRPTTGPDSWPQPTMPSRAGDVRRPLGASSLSFDDGVNEYSPKQFDETQYPDIYAPKPTGLNFD